MRVVVDIEIRIDGDDRCGHEYNTKYRNVFSGGERTQLAILEIPYLSAQKTDR